MLTLFFQTSPESFKYLYDHYLEHFTEQIAYLIHLVLLGFYPIPLFGTFSCCFCLPNLLFSFLLFWYIAHASPVLEKCPFIGDVLCIPTVCSPLVTRAVWYGMPPMWTVWVLFWWWVYYCCGPVGVACLWSRAMGPVSSQVWCWLIHGLSWILEGVIAELEVLDLVLGPFPNTVGCLELGVPKLMLVSWWKELDPTMAEW